MARHTSGYIKIHRRILGSWIARDGNALSVWITLLLWANRERGTESLKRQPIVLERGQLATSCQEIAMQVKLNVKTVERVLTRLADDGRIVEQKSNCGRVITIVNYDKYQGVRHESGERLSDDLSSECPAERGAKRSAKRGAERIHNGEDKKLNNIKPPLSPLPSSVSSRSAKAAIRDLAREATIEVTQAYTATQDGERGAYDALPLATRELVIARFGSLKRCHDEIRAAFVDRQQVPFVFMLEKHFANLIQKTGAPQAPPGCGPEGSPNRRH